VFERCDLRESASRLGTASLSTFLGFPGSLTSTFLGVEGVEGGHGVFERCDLRALVLLKEDREEGVRR
jgi:hypothetical protein